MDKPTTYTPGVAHLEVSSTADHITEVSTDGMALDLLYCCAQAIVDISVETGNSPLAGVFQVNKMVAAIEAVNSKPRGETKIDMGPIKAAVERLKDKAAEGPEADR